MGIDPRYKAPLDVKNTEAYQAREFLDAVGHGQWLKRVILAFVALFVVLYIAYSLVSPAQWKRWKNNILGTGPGATQVTPDPAATPPPSPNP